MFVAIVLQPGEEGSSWRETDGDGGPSGGREGFKFEGWPKVGGRGYKKAMQD